MLYLQTTHLTGFFFPLSNHFISINFLHFLLSFSSHNYLGHIFDLLPEKVCYDDSVATMLTPSGWFKNSSRMCDLVCLSVRMQWVKKHRIARASFTPFCNVVRIAEKIDRMTERQTDRRTNLSQRSGKMWI